MRSSTNRRKSVPKKIRAELQSQVQPDDWHQWRSQGIGASEAAAVCGLSRWRSPYQIWLAKTGNRTGEQAENEAMWWGTAMEPVIAAAYERRTGDKLSVGQICCEHPDYDWMRATLDHLGPGNRIVELKTAGMNSARDLPDDGDTDGLPNEWLLQVQHQLAVTGLDWADLAVFHPSLQLRIYPIERCDSIIDALIEQESEFWQAVESREEPPPITPEDTEAWSKRIGNTGTMVDLKGDTESLLTAVEYLELGKKIKALEDTRDQARSRLIQALGTADVAELDEGWKISRKVIEIPERIQLVKTHTQLRISVKEPRNGNRNA
jgi:putative phage-type endonuclease